MCIEWDESGEVPSLTWKNHKRTLEHNVLSSEPEAIVGRLIVPLTIQGNVEVMGEFISDQQLSGSVATVQHCLDHLVNKGMARLTLISPSYFNVNKGHNIRAIVCNFSPKKVTICPDELSCCTPIVSEVSVLKGGPTSFC